MNLCGSDHHHTHLSRRAWRTAVAQAKDRHPPTAPLLCQAIFCASQAKREHLLYRSSQAVFSAHAYGVSLYLESTPCVMPPANLSHVLTPSGYHVMPFHSCSPTLPSPERRRLAPETRLCCLPTLRQLPAQAWKQRSRGREVGRCFVSCSSPSPSSSSSIPSTSRSAIRQTSASLTPSNSHSIPCRLARVQATLLSPRQLALAYLGCGTHVLWPTQT